MSSRIAEACARAAAAAAASAGDRASPAGGPATARRWFVAGDPQTTPARLFAVLDRHGLLGDDGWLRPDAGLVSIGDHFDFPGPLAEVERSGREILAWLAAHPADQVVILAGNHDLSRVMELAFETDATFADARALAERIEALEEGSAEAAALRRDFAERFPRIPTPGIARRDYGSFSEAQRALVQRLLLEGRMRLAVTARIEGEPALLTHAAVTKRELALLDLSGSRDVAAIAASLERRLALAVAAVRAAWEKGEPAALDLAPLHVAGTTGREGGGLLYHRPARRDRPGVAPNAERSWAFDRDSPRRFDPSELPPGLLQIAGHSHHRRCVIELAGWVDEEAERAEHLAIRTLRADGPCYLAGVHVANAEAALVLVDPHFAAADLHTIELLPLDEPPISSPRSEPTSRSSTHPTSP